jgi:ubiquinone/menaquinone biosynthesis C-methylase UbiE
VISKNETLFVKALNLIKTACPKCKSKLVMEFGKVICINCGSSYRITNDIIKFVEKDNFYEGKFGAEGVIKIGGTLEHLKYLFQKTTVSGINYRTKHVKFMPRKGDALIKVLDVGCGGGNVSLAYIRHHYRRFYIVGIDLSISSLLNAKYIYDEVHQASATAIPFPDKTFDCVCSFDLLGHIPLELKDNVLKEINRVLKPGGLTFHYIEVDAQKGINHWAKKYPNFYQKYFLENEGHFGLEHYRKVLSRFRKHGFELLRILVMCKLIRPVGQISARLDNELKEKSKELKLLVALDKITKSNLIAQAILGTILLLP